MPTEFWALLGGMGIGAGLVALVWAAWWVRRAPRPVYGPGNLRPVPGPPDPRAMADDDEPWEPRRVPPGLGDEGCRRYYID